FIFFSTRRFIFYLSFYFLRYLHSFPTRRSSDLVTGYPEDHYRLEGADMSLPDLSAHYAHTFPELVRPATPAPTPDPHIVVLNEQDRKSTRLNSSHVSISYAVFCLKKKNQKIKEL